jgi:LysR family glycine cleavage system transcriptional activator
LRANADPFAGRLAEQLNRQIGVRETIYLVSRTEQARDRRIAAFRRWNADAVGRAK